MSEFFDSSALHQIKRFPLSQDFLFLSEEFRATRLASQNEMQGRSSRFFLAHFASHKYEEM
jgi:hypothetical protein